VDRTAVRCQRSALKLDDMERKFEVGAPYFSQMLSGVWNIHVVCEFSPRGRGRGQFLEFKAKAEAKNNYEKITK